MQSSSQNVLCALSSLQSCEPLPGGMDAMKHKVSLHDLFCTYFFSYPFFAVAIYALMTITGNPLNYLLVHAMLWIPGYLYWLRGHADRFPNHGTLVALHLPIFLMFLPYLLLGWTDTFFVVLPLLLFLFFFSLSMLTTGLHLTITSEPLALFGALFLVLFFNTQSDDLRFYLTLTVAILILLYWADLHYTHVDSILDHSSSVLHQDEKSTRRRSHSLFLGACLCTLVIALVSIFLGLDEGLGYLITPILQTAQHLFRQVFPLAEDAEELLPFDDPEWFEPQGRKWWEELRNGHESVFWQSMEYLVFLLFAVLLVLVIAWFFRRMRRKYAPSVVSKETAYHEEKDLYVENLTSVKPSVRIKDSSNARKVRRIYQKTVEKKINEGLSITPDKTPGEIRQMVDTPVFNQLTALYERARYTEEPISSQELREVGRHHSE